MENTTQEVSELIRLIEQKAKMVAMVAPSFPIDFSSPAIIGMLKRLGFEYVVEVSRGAIDTNRQLLALMKLHPEKRYITSPCPSIVRLIKTKYPDLFSFLADIDSPMSATAKIVVKKYPGYKKVYIGPCFVKKLEAKEDWPELDILVLTFKELESVFKAKKISASKGDRNLKFDIEGFATRLYPISGGLAHSSGLTQALTDEEYDVVSGPALAEKSLKDFPVRTGLKLLDILFCEGGCISGGGIISKEFIEIKRKKISDYWEKTK